MVRGKCKEFLSPLCLWKVAVLPGPCRCWERTGKLGNWTKGSGRVFNKQHHKRHLSQCIPFCSSEAPPEPFPLSCLLPLITEFTYCPLGKQKGHFRFAGKEMPIEAKTLTCMQTVTVAVKVIFTHGRKIWGIKMAKQCRRQPGPL